MGVRQRVSENERLKNEIEAQTDINLELVRPSENVRRVEEDDRMTRLKIFLSRAFPFAARDESINCVIERSRQKGFS